MLRGFGASGLRARLPNVTGDGIRPTSAHRPFSPDLKVPTGVHRCPVRRSLNHSAPKSQTTSPKTPQIHSISPKWSALWAHPSPTPPMWKQQQGLRGLPQCPWATEPGQTSETTHRATLAARTASRRAAAHGHRHTKQPDPATTRNDYDSETSVLASPATPSPRASRRARPR